MFLALIGLLQAISVSGEPWVVTSYMQESFITAPGTTLATSTNFIVPASPVPPALATETIIETGDDYVRLTKIHILLPPTVKVATTTLAPSSQSSLPTYYHVPITYTPQSKCSATWEYVTIVQILVPPEVRPQLVPWTIITSSTTYRSPWGTLTGTDISASTEIDAVLYPTDVADDVYFSASLFALPNQIRSCEHPAISQPTTTYPPGPSRAVPTKPVTGVSTYGIKCGADNPQCIFCFKVKQNW